MKINSELPLTMLDMNMELNEYDFVLFHLYKQYPKYREYYKRMRHENPGRLMIFDNSAYEFYVKGETLDLAEYADAIIDLRPDLFILPDVLMDKDKTIDKTFKFLSQYYFSDIIHSFAFSAHYIPKPLAVAQGNTADELFDCLMLYYNERLKYVAIPFHNSFYKQCPDNNAMEMFVNNMADDGGHVWGTDDMRYAAGRVRFVKQAELLLKKFHHVHLLGSHCPMEKKLYGNYIKTIDTGYPVKCGIAGYELEEEPTKPDIIIDDFMTKRLSQKTKDLIIRNVNKFREYGTKTRY
jgi:hypothetical protein